MRQVGRYRSSYRSLFLFDLCALQHQSPLALDAKHVPRTTAHSLIVPLLLKHSDSHAEAGRISPANGATLTLAQASRILGYSERMLPTLKAVATLFRTAFHRSSVGPKSSVWCPFGDASCIRMLKK